MHKSKESAVFAELLAESFPTTEARAAHEREVAKLVAFAELLIALDEVRAGSKISKAGAGASSRRQAFGDLAAAGW